MTFSWNFCKVFIEKSLSSGEKLWSSTVKAKRTIANQQNYSTKELSPQKETERYVSRFNAN